MNPSQSSSILRDITGNQNRQLSRVNTDQGKLRSKSLCNNNKRYVDNNENDNSRSRLSKYNERVQNIESNLRQNHRVSIEQFSESKLNKQSSTSYAQKYQKPNANNYSTNSKYSLWSVPLNTIKQSTLVSVQDQIISIAQNQHSYLLLLSNNTFKALNKSNLSQNTSLSNVVNDFIRQQSIILKQIYATPFATFFIDNNQGLYAMGLNDRGQLGINSQKIITYPTQVSLPSSNNKSKASLKSKIQSITKISKIQGGPFHTVILTSSNKAHYSGILYEQSELQNDQYINAFRQISIKNDQNIKDICCGLTSVIFLTESNRIYLMGIFGDNVFSNPTELQFPFRSQIKYFVTVNDCIYINTEKGNFYKADMTRKIPIITEINLNQMVENRLDKNQKSKKITVQNLYNSNNQLIIVSKQFLDKQSNKFVYSYFVQQQQQGQNHNSQKISQFKQLQLPSLKQITTKKIFIDNNHLNFVVSSQQSEKLTSIKKSIQQKILTNQNQINSYLVKIKQLQQENDRLKKQNTQLNKQKKQKTPKKQDKLTLSNINYNFEKQVTPRTFTHDLQIQFSQIKLTKKIAEGGYGIIYKGEWKKTEVAVKIFKIDENNTNSVKEFISQCRAMQALRHPNIVMFLGACMKKPNFSIVLQYCEGGTLWSLLQNHKIDLPWKERVRLAIETAKAMNYLHDRKNPIVHRDLKSLNVLLDANRKVKLADFGWTKSLQNYMTSKIGTYQWMAPQVLTGQKYSQKADVFSFSIILWQIASRQPPYRNINGIQVAYDVANKEYRPSIPSGTPEFFQKLIIKCWEKDSQKRPSFKQIIEILEKQYNTIS